MTDDPTKNARQSAHSDRGPDAGTAAPRSDRPDPGAGAMGPLEFATYRRFWRSSASFRHHLAATAAQHKGTVAKPEITTSSVAGPNESSTGAVPRTDAGLPALRLFREAAESTEDSARPDRGRSPARFPTSPARAAAALLFARIFDERPDLLHSIRSAAPTIVINIADPEMLDHVAAAWQDVLFDDPSRLTDIGSDSARYRTELDAAYLAVKKPSKAAHKDRAERLALRALSLALPVIAISQMAKTHLPDALNKAATARIEFPRLDATVIAHIIRIVTGTTCR